MPNRNRENILREIDEAIAELRTYSNSLVEKRIERLELERDWICAHPAMSSDRHASLATSSRRPIV